MIEIKIVAIVRGSARHILFRHDCENRNLPIFHLAKHLMAKTRTNGANGGKPNFATTPSTTVGNGGEWHQQGTGETLTTNQGVPVADNPASDGTRRLDHLERVASARG
jgi:hypothetical protein